MMRRERLEEMGGFAESLPACEDYDLWLRVCLRYPVHYLDEPLVVKHGGHEDQLSRRIWGLDRFRIRALEKLVEAGHLSAADRRASVAILLAKIEIYLEGVKKRGRLEEVARYQERLERWRSEQTLGEPT